MKKATRQADGTVMVETMSAEEEKDLNDCAAHGIAAKAAHEDAITQKATDRAAATTKLKTLGLTDAEIAALSG
tara:strand:- start:65 stop:283 length:219 start_codon:yes stop_codon:yes gene_type:complete